MVRFTAALQRHIHHPAYRGIHPDAQRNIRPASHQTY
jgi:hypothetical protein